MKKINIRSLIACMLSLSFLFVFGGCTLRPSDTDTTVETNDGLETEPEKGEDEAIQSQPTPAEKLLWEMSLSQKVAQLFVVCPEQVEIMELAEDEHTLIYTEDTLKYNVGGIILFAENIINRNQCSSLISAMQNASEVPLFVSVDEEGGSVARLGNNPNMGVTKFSNMAEITSEEEAYNVGKTIGSEIKELGFNLDFAPVADVNSNPQNPIIGVRSFGDDPEYVSRQVAAAVRGFNSSGTLCTLKHFPGHGDTVTDSHLGYTQIDKTLEQLRQIEFPPFISGIEAGADFVMVAHISVPEVTGDDLPATLSPEMIDILKNELNFKGLIITDALRMEAVSDRFTSAQAAVMSLAAGTDVLLCPENLDEAINGVIEAVNSGTLSVERIDESVLKILNLKFERGIIK